MKFFAIIFSLALCQAVFAGNNKTYKAHWHEKDISDFQSSTARFQYSEKEHFYYCISNDKENVYLDLKIMDNDLQRQLYRSGIMIWINKDGDKKKKNGIKYPARPENAAPSKRQNVPYNRDYSRPALEDQEINAIELIGFSGSVPEFIPSGKNNLRGSITRDNMYSYYELVIPFSTLSQIAPSRKKTEVLSLGIGCNIGAFSQNGVSGNRQTHRGGHGNFGGGGHGRGMSGGHMRGGGGMYGGGIQARGGYQSPSSGSEKLMWIKNIKLASE